MKVIGIDPGLATVGIGIVDTLSSTERRNASGEASRTSRGASPLALRSSLEGSKVRDWCTIETSKGLTLPQRLSEIAKDLSCIIKQYKPDLAVIEKLYFETNVKTAIDVAQARGVIVLTVENAGIPILEPTPLELKSAVAGDGRADKKQMQDMIEMMLGEKCTSDDAADALGLAIYGTLIKNLTPSIGGV